MNQLPVGSAGAIVPRRRHRSRVWLAFLVLSAGCNSLFDIQEPAHRAVVSDDTIPCTLTSDCPVDGGLICLFSHCSAPCHDDRDCASGNHCLHTDDGTACVSATQPRCSDAAGEGCPAGTSCTDGVCYSGCSDVAPCLDGHDCVNSLCKDAPTPSAGGAGGAGAADGDGVATSGTSGAAAGGTSGAAAGGEGGALGGQPGLGGAPSVGISGGGGSSGSEGGNSGSGGGIACVKNACGGCTVLAGTLGAACGSCGQLACSGQNALACQSKCTAPLPLCGTGNECVACLGDADCPAATPVCNNQACVVCKPGVMTCSGTTPVTCKANGSGSTSGTVQAGVCNAICNPGSLRCTSTIGQKCSVDGSFYGSSGSNTACGCSDTTGRFNIGVDGKIKDTKTGLKWDFAEHAPDTQAGATATCGASGMRLPTQLELEGLLVTGAAAAACSLRLYLSIDSVAFPAIVANTRYWTSDPEGSQPGFLIVVYFFGPSTTTGSSGYGTTDRQSANLVNFQCVQSN